MISGHAGQYTNSAPKSLLKRTIGRALGLTTFIQNKYIRLTVDDCKDIRRPRDPSELDLKLLFRRDERKQRNEAARRAASTRLMNDLIAARPMAERLREGN